MATTSNPMSLLAAELRRSRQAEKRRRVEEEEEEEPGGAPELPPEMQLQLVETVEAAQRSVVAPPPSRLVEPARAWRAVYELWKEGRVVRMEHPPKMISLELARLFVSPRFKLVTKMQWSAVRQILEAYADVQAEARVTDEIQLATLVLYRLRPKSPGDTWSWAFFYLGEIVKHEKDNLIFAGIRVRDVATPVRTLEFHDGLMSFSDSSPPSIVDDMTGRVIELEDVLIYGRVLSLVSKSAFRGIIGGYRILLTMQTLFTFDLMRFDKPTIGMLAWKDKIVMFRVAIFPSVRPAVENLRVDVFYVPKGQHDEQMIITHVSLVDAPSIGDINNAANAESALHVADLAGAIYNRKEIVWPNGTRLELKDSRKQDEPGRGFVLPEHENARDVIQSLVMQLPEPALERLANRPEWGYEMSMYLPTLPRTSEIGGMMMMPAPWFFFFMMNVRNVRSFIFAGGIVRFFPATISLFALDDAHILVHQPHELIFLPDDLDERPLEELAMLQRRELAERATAPLVEELERGVTLL